MTDNVLIFDGVTRLEIPVSRVLEGALEADLESVIVLGFTKEGAEYIATNKPDGGKVMWMMERCKHKLMEIADDGK